MVVDHQAHTFINGTEDAFETRLGIAYRFHDGKITEIAYFQSFEEALEAAGLRE